MDTNKFWDLIETAREGSADGSETAARLKGLLDRLPPDEVLAFQQEIWQRLNESYRWDLWAVAYIVNGGCSDDGFEYFRGWLISQGRQYFEAALDHAPNAADHAEPDANECEDILYLASAIYQAKTGRRPARTGFQQSSEPAGVQWDEDQLPELYPGLCERFL
jgi:hypothetical protein